MMNKNYKLLYYGICTGFVLLAIIFFFCDLDISKALASDNPNFVYQLLAAIGEFPIYIGPILFGLVFSRTIESKCRRLMFGFIGFVGTYLALMRLSNGILEEFFNAVMISRGYILLAIASLLIYVLLFRLISGVDIKTLYKIQDVACMYLIVAISSFLVVLVMKYTWGRPRFRVLSNEYEGYVNFLRISGLKNSLLGDEYLSFPSGHTNAATSIIIFSIIPKRMGWKKWIRIFVFSVCLVYPCLVGISRIGVGAHYASDVLFGGFISLGCLFITYMIFKKRGWLYVRGD